MPLSQDMYSCVHLSHPSIQLTLYSIVKSLFTFALFIYFFITFHLISLLFLVISSTLNAKDNDKNDDDYAGLISRFDFKSIIDFTVKHSSLPFRLFFNDVGPASASHPSNLSCYSADEDNTVHDF